jgi:nitrite reductase/ring-hydroxylating ferredoxin subunit
MQLGDLSGLGEGEMRCFAGIGPNGVLVCRVEGALHAVDDRCTHAMAPLSAGRLRGGKVMCPLHGASFDVATGAHGGPPAAVDVRVYELRSDDETAVEIVMPR